MQRTAITGFLVACVVFPATLARAKPADEAVKAYASGKDLLAKADFDGALKAFKAAARADAENTEYAQQYALLRQVIRIRRDCATEQDAERWLKMAEALRSFYSDNRLYSEALPLDAELHRRRGSAESAVGLAETQIALGMYNDAVGMLDSLTEKQTSPHTTALHGLALARLGRIDEAKALAEKARQGGDDAGPQHFYHLARLQALIGDSEGSTQTLTRSFELTPPSRLDAFKAEARKCEDFSTLVSSADFARVLETQSKIEESGCSMGPSCGKCPMRAKCGHASAEEKKKKP